MQKRYTFISFVLIKKKSNKRNIYINLQFHLTPFDLSNLSSILYKHMVVKKTKTKTKRKQKPKGQQLKAVPHDNDTTCNFI